MPRSSRDAAVFDGDDVGALRARLDLDRDVAVEGLDRGRRAEDRVGHLHLECRQEVVAVAAVDVVVLNLDLEVEVAVRAAGGADLALAGHLQADAGVDAGGDVDGDRAAGADATLGLAGRAGVRDDRAVAAAGAAGARGHHVAEERAHLAVDRPGAVADVAGLRAGARCAARAVAGLAQHGRVDLDVALDAEDDVFEVDLEAQQGVLPTLAA